MRPARLARIARTVLAATFAGPRRAPRSDERPGSRIAGAATKRIAHLALLLLLFEAIAGPFDLPVHVRVAIVVGCGAVGGAAVEGLMTWMERRPRRSGAPT